MWDGTSSYRLLEKGIYFKIDFAYNVNHYQRLDQAETVCNVITFWSDFVFAICCIKENSFMDLHTLGGLSRVCG